MRKIKQFRFTNITNSSSTQMLLVLNDQTLLEETVLVGAFLPSSNINNFSKIFLNLEKKKSFENIMNDFYKKARFVSNIQPLDEDLILATSDKDLIKVYLYYLALDIYNQALEFANDIEANNLVQDMKKFPLELAKTFGIETIGKHSLKFFSNNQNNFFEFQFGTYEEIYANYLFVLLSPNLHRKTFEFDLFSSIENYIELLDRLKSILIFIFSDNGYTNYDTIYSRLQKHIKNAINKVIKGAEENIPIFTRKNIYSSRGRLIKNIKPHLYGTKFSLRVPFNFVSYRKNELILYNQEFNYWIAYEVWYAKP